MNGGYTEARFNTTDLRDATGITATTVSLASRTYHGWFLGGGTEFADRLIPGLFWKSEYRFADYGSKDNFAVASSGLAARLERTTHSIALIPTCRPSRPNWSIASTGAAPASRY